MDDITVLAEFLKSTIPAAIVAKALAFTPLVTALVNLLRRNVPFIEARKKIAAPTTAIAFGLVFGNVTIGFDAQKWLIGVGCGLLIGLASIGAFSGGKSVSGN